ncbi:unnamed protein product [Diatraea saccharalis]|uniref:Uncharacterized protein n=1 Tax=Diatraea saccharalis TaxID=40085 RepID=A0A9N9RDQ9_9NEOP|nr:unnamed protein product [Diatraea saccharalis]
MSPFFALVLLAFVHNEAAYIEYQDSEDDQSDDADFDDQYESEVILVISHQKTCQNVKAVKLNETLPEHLELDGRIPDYSGAIKELLANHQLNLMTTYNTETTTDYASPKYEVLTKDFTITGPTTKIRLEDPTNFYDDVIGRIMDLAKRQGFLTESTTQFQTQAMTEDVQTMESCDSIYILSNPKIVAKPKRMPDVSFAYSRTLGRYEKNQSLLERTKSFPQTVQHKKIEAISHIRRTLSDATQDFDAMYYGIPERIQNIPQLTQTTTGRTTERFITLKSLFPLDEKWGVNNLIPKVDRKKHREVVSIRKKNDGREGSKGEFSEGGGIVGRKVGRQEDGKGAGAKGERSSRKFRRKVKGGAGAMGIAEIETTTVTTTTVTTTTTTTTTTPSTTKFVEPVKIESGGGDTGGGDTGGGDTGGGDTGGGDTGGGESGDGEDSKEGSGVDNGSGEEDDEEESYDEEVVFSRSAGTTTTTIATTTKQVAVPHYYPYPYSAQFIPNSTTSYITKIWRTRRRRTTTKPTTTSTMPPFNIPGLVAIISDLTDNFETNITDMFKKTLQKYNIPTCPSDETTETPIFHDLVNATVVSKCFVCGMTETEIPRDSYCSDAFSIDFIPLVPMDPQSRGRIVRFRKYCRYLDVDNFYENATEPRSVFGRFTGGCSVRWIDISSVYTQRACRNRRHATTGRHFGSKRMAKLEMALHVYSSKPFFGACSTRVIWGLGLVIARASLRPIHRAPAASWRLSQPGVHHTRTLRESGWKPNRDSSVSSTTGHWLPSQSKCLRPRRSIGTRSGLRVFSSLFDHSQATSALTRAFEKTARP